MSGPGDPPQAASTDASLGQGSYAQTPYGGRSVESSTPTLAAYSPDGSSSSAVNTTISFQVTCQVDLDPYSLQVVVGGEVVILAGAWSNASYGGSLNVSGGVCDVLIDAHPDFTPGQTVLVEIVVANLAGESAAPSFEFHIKAADVDLAESLTLSESMLDTDGLSAFVVESITKGEALVVRTSRTLANDESLTISETVQARSFSVAVVDSTTLRLFLADELCVEGVGDEGRFQIVPVDGGFPMTVRSSTPEQETVATGEDGAVVPMFKAAGLAAFESPSPNVSTLTDPNANFLQSGVGVGDKIAVETEVSGQMEFTVSAVNSDMELEIQPQVVGLATAYYRVNDHPAKVSYFFRRPSFTANLVHLGDYISVSSPANSVLAARVVEIVNPFTVRVDAPLVVDGSAVVWAQRTGVTSILFRVSEGTTGKRYLLGTQSLRTKALKPFEATISFSAVGGKPHLTGVSFLPDGTVLLDFDEDMRFDAALASPDEYTIDGPTSVIVSEVVPMSPRQVALKTSGLSTGSYTVTVNASGTPKDAAGNPIDPTFNQAVFTASAPILTRSIFTDRGPIAKPAETLQSGTGVTLHTYTSPIFGPSMSFTSNEVTLSGGSFVADHVGLCLEITGTALNDGTYKVLGLVGAGPTARVQLQASFQLPDANNGTGTWRLFDPRDGQIADDPGDVTVRVNGVPVAPEAVVGLLGQVVLPMTPGPEDDVKIDYSWVPNPVVDFRRLNSREFVLNNWAYDAGQRGTPSQHKYRYRSALVTPESYTPGDMSATLDQPLVRDVHYRAYERAYSALLNDPALLLLNTPNHKISYAPLSRTVVESSVSYMGNTLPEAASPPWERKGGGLASVLSGVLTVEDNTGGPFPAGSPLYWQRDVDLSFEHVFAATWRMAVSAVSAIEGVFTGVAFGWSDESRAVALGYLEENGVKKLGILKAGRGNDPSEVGAWVGGLDSFGSPTGEPAEFDWSALHSYRFFRGRDGVVRLYVDGETQELLRVTEDDLPFLNELNAPFSEMQGVFFGSISRPAKTVSEWDFVRYVVLPTNPEQSEPSVRVAYEGGVLPEVASQPWTPVGYHGNEHISTTGRLLLSSTSATDPAIEPSVGLVGGDFRAMSRIEPLLSVASDVVIDAEFKILSHTHGISPNAVALAVDDGYRLVQLSLFPYSGQPKLSYPGRSLPEDAVPVAWSKAGTATAEMLGRTLRLSDVGSDGIAYAASDTAAADSTARIFGSLPDYTFEFCTRVISFEADASGFCGLTASVYDDLRHVGVRFVRSVAGAPFVTGSGAPSGTTWVDGTKNFVALGVLPGDELQVGASTYAITNVSATVLVLNFAVPISGAYTIKKATRRVEFHSNGQSLAVPKVWDFDWYDGKAHTVRAVKSASSGTVILSGFLGSVAHFNVGTGVSRFTDSATTLASLQVGDHIIVESGPSTGAYPVTAIVNATTVEINGLPVESSGVVWSVQRGRNATVALIIDDELVGSAEYDEFTTAVGGGAYATFGSTVGVSDSRSVVEWVYFNAWRTSVPLHRYIGIWKGYDDDKLTGFHLPTKAAGVANVTQTVSGTTYLSDADASFAAAGVGAGDHLIVDDGGNKGVYEVVSVSQTELGVKPAMGFVPTQVSYRVAKTVDWSVDHRYRIVRDSAGSVALFLDAASAPAIQIPYSEVSLPASLVGLPSVFHSRMPSVTWGAMDPANLSQTDWSYIRYAISRSPTEDRIIPAHQVLNQRNVMSSPEHLRGSVLHDHTQYSASSTGVPYPWTSYVEEPLVDAFTKLNEGTPIVPLTQTYEVRRPTPVFKPVSALNSPGDVLNSDRDFLLNDGTVKVELLVPDDVLYRSLEIVEKTAGDLNLLEPFTDTGMVSVGPVNYTKDICLHYDASVLPEDDTTSPTPWTHAAEPGATFSRSTLNGLLSYTVSGGQVLYRNDTPLTDPASLDTEVAFKLTVLNDATMGTGDSGIRMGFSAFGLTAALAFVTTPLGDREVRLLDLNANEVLGSIFFDYLDGMPHTYRLKKNVEEGVIEFSID